MSTIHAVEATSRYGTSQPEAADFTRLADSHPLLLSIPGAAAFAGLKERAMRHLFTQRVFPVVALGTRLYVRRSDLIAYIDSHTEPVRSPNRRT